MNVTVIAFLKSLLLIIQLSQMKHKLPKILKSFLKLAKGIETPPKELDAKQLY